MKLIGYLRARLDERSTWLMFGTSVAGVTALPAPWSYVALGVGVMAALVPDGAVK